MFALQVICHTSTNNVPFIPHGIHGVFHTREAAMQAKANLLRSASQMHALVDCYIVEDGVMDSALTKGKG